MDVIYHWKNHQADVKAGRIGHFKSTADKLSSFTSGFPDFLWVFKTPQGRPGEVQLLARLRWADKSAVTLKPEPGHPYMHYDPNDAKSVLFEESDTEAAITETTLWIGKHFPKMVAANFQGANGQEAVRGDTLNELQRLASKFGTRPFAG